MLNFPVIFVVLKDPIEALNSPKAFSSYGEVKDWLEEELGVRANYDVVHKLVCYKLKYKLNLSRRKSL